MHNPRLLETRELTRRPRDFAFDLPSHVADEFISDRLFARGPSPQAATAGVSFSINPITQSVTEGGTISFKISISNPNYPAIGSYKIYWRTNATADHAASTSDYNSVASLQALTFSATSAQSYTVSIHTNTDSSIEGTEYFEVDLYDFQGNYLSGSATVFTIFDVPPARADLQIGNLTVTPSSVQTGGGFTVSAWIFNNGNATAGASTAKLYLSRNGSIDSNDFLIGTFSISSLVPNGRSVDFGKSLLLPSDWQSGTSYIIVDADTAGAITESNENNNSLKRSFTVTTPTTIADLQIGNLMVTPGSVQTGGGFTVSAWIFNNGNATAGASTAKLYLSRDGSIDSNDFLIGTFSISSLAPDARSIDFGKSVLLPSNWQSGTSYIIVDADTTSAVNETNEANNSFKQSFTVTAPTSVPDLAIGDLTVTPSSVDPGSSISVTFSILNVGNATAAASSARLYISRDQYFDPADIAIGSAFSIPSLTSNQPDSRTVSVQIPPSWTPGASYIIIVADVGGALTESSEANNSWGRMITVSGASGDTPVSGPNAVRAYDDPTPYSATGTEIVDIARRYLDAQWGAQNCTGFVWLVADQATRNERSRYFDKGDHYVQNGTKVIDAGTTAGYVVPGPSIGDNPDDRWDHISNTTNYRQTDWFSVVIKGDIVRVSGASFDGGVHSFIVSKVEGSGASRRVWIIDNTGVDASDPTHTILATIREYEVLNTSFQQALRTAPNVWVQRLDTTVATTAAGAAYASSWTDGSDVRELTGGPSDDVLRINAVIGSAGTFALAGNSSGKVLLTNTETGSLLLTADEFEEVEIYGGMGDNRLLIGSLEGTDVAFSTVYFFGREGSDVVDAYGTDRRIVVSAGAGADRLTGGAGDDVLDGGAGVDSMAGGLGSDSYIVDNSNDWVLERAGEGDLDRIFSSVSYSMAAGIYVEILSADSDHGTAPLSLAGNELDNIIRGNAGDNNLFGLGGNDELTGLGGNDNYVLDNPLDRVVEAPNEGYDAIFVSFSYALTVDVSIEVLATSDFSTTTAINLTGNSLNQQIQGNAGANVLDGGAGSDLLVGGAGNDILIGGAGGDNMYGGAGADTFVFTSFADMQGFAIRSDGKKFFADVLADFVTGEDKLDLSAIDAISGTPGNDAFTFIGHGAFSNHAGELRGYVESGVVRLAGDLDGDGVGDFVITVAGSIYVTDIIL